MDSLNVKIGKRGAPPMLTKWLGFSKADADRRFFWIHRANCFPAKDQGKIRTHCSDKFIDKAINLVRPKVIITLGKTAASYFSKVKSLKGFVKKSLDQGLTFSIGGKTYPVVPFSHPSWRADKWRQDNADLHRKTKNVATHHI
jgi:uracil-DNA glycosylase